MHQSLFRILAIAIVALACPTAVTAQARTITVLPMGNDRPDSADFISASCETDAKQQTMTCEFTQVAIYRKTSQPEVDEAVKKALSDFTPEKAKAFQSECGSLAKDIQAARGSLASADNTIKRYASDWFAAVEAACKSPTRANLEALERAAQAGDLATCKVWVNRWTHTFTKQSAVRWVSNDGPNGICGTILISILEPRDGDSDFFWKYSQQRVITNKDVKEPIPCKEFEAEPTSYSANKTKKLSCELIEAGGFQ